MSLPGKNLMDNYVPFVTSPVTSPVLPCPQGVGPTRATLGVRKHPFLAVIWVDVG